MVVVLLVSIGIVMAVGGFIWGAYRVARYYEEEDRGDKRDEKRLRWIGPVALLLAGIVWMIFAATGTAQVPATHVAVVENTWTGTFSKLGPGTYIFPFQPRLIPFVTHVTKYSLRPADGQVEVGEPTDGRTFDIKRAVEADSNSPGRPSVYFWARVWAYPNKDMIIDLHKRYGSDYLDNWIEKVYIAALKSVQGRSEYFYVGQDRVEFQNEVEKALQAQLVASDGTPLVYVQQLAVVNFKFSDATEAFLQSVQKIEFDRQQAEQQIEVNRKQQEAQKISADTSFIVETRNAERDRDAMISRATGDAEKVKLAADAEAYRVLQTKTAEAKGIGLVQEAISRSPAAYLEYLRAMQWNGSLPQYWLGDGVLPFLDITPKEENK